jgi:hypothetical protein
MLECHLGRSGNEHNPGQESVLRSPQSTQGRRREDSPEVRPDNLDQEESTIAEYRVPDLRFRLETFVCRACPLAKYKHLLSNRDRGAGLTAVSLVDN